MDTVKKQFIFFTNNLMDMSVGLGCKNAYLFTMSILNTIFLRVFYKVYAKYGAKNCILHNVIMNIERKSIA